MTAHYRRAERKKSNGFARINRLSGNQGIQFVRLSDISPLGLSFETLTKTPYAIGEKVLIVDADQLDVKEQMSTVRHVSTRSNSDGENVFVVGVEFDL